MKKRMLVEFIISWILIILGGLVTLFPLISVTNVKTVFIGIISIYGVAHLLKNFFILGIKDYSGFSTALSSMLVLIIMFFIDINDSPWNLALVLFIWIILMSLTKLKECDFYHDNINKLWRLNVVNLVLFIIIGILTTINLYYTSDIQILILGFFFLINGILELMDPLASYVIDKEN